MSRLAAACAALAAVFALALTTAAPAGASVMGHRRLDAWAYARHHQGCWYAWAQDGPCWAGYDCSGFAKAAYRHAGYWLPHSTYAMLSSGRLVRISHARSKVGDLAFYGSGHVEVVAGRHYTNGAQQPGTRTGYHRWTWGSWWHPTGFYRLRW